MDLDRLLARIDALIAKGQSVRLLPDAEQFTIGPLHVKAGDIAEWRAQSLHLLRSTLGSKHTYVDEFERLVVETRAAGRDAGVGVLAAFRADVAAGDLQELSQLVAAEVLSDFIEMAEELHSHGYFLPTASLLGAVLEDSLRRAAKMNDLKASGNLESLNDVCGNAAIFPRSAHKQVKVWIDIRNAADHGQFDKVDHAFVTSWLRDMPGFLRTHLNLQM